MLHAGQSEAMTRGIRAIRLTSYFQTTTSNGYWRNNGAYTSMCVPEWNGISLSALFRTVVWAFAVDFVGTIDFCLPYIPRKRVEVSRKDRCYIWLMFWTCHGYAWQDVCDAVSLWESARFACFVCCFFGIISLLEVNRDKNVIQTRQKDTPDYFHLDSGGIHTRTLTRSRVYTSPLSRWK